MSLFEKIDTICLQVYDVEQSSEWYQDVVGLKEVYKDRTYRILSVENGGTPITIEENKELIDSRHHTVYPIFFTKDITKAFTHLKENGVTVGSLKRDGTNYFFDFFDLDHNKLQVCYWK
ncbi:VOC family protein [Bacillus sp. NTK071]|uniref:VOC family protein n=1 Tax=Bacillus sp. NTK071 TaxID=2802175 RepID=UPI001A8DB979|nr:VOC family protein [Bacillus sp. NTK071]MBN8208159.1 VOC family protein [Bacillus sp. NTK071]